MNIAARDGKVCAEITLRDILDRTEDLSGTPVLAEIKRLYDENDMLRDLVRNLIRATHPADRATLIANATEFGIEVEP